MSLFATGCLSIFVGVVALFVGYMDYRFPDQSIQWYMYIFEKQIKTYDVLFFIGLLAIAIGLVCILVRIIKKLIKKMKRKHRKHHHHKHSHSKHRPHMKSLAEAPRKTCPNCNARLIPASKFCNICGEKLEEDSEQAENVQEAAEQTVEQTTEE